MHNEMNNTGISPRSLTDKELVKFSERYAHTDGMPKEFQLELIKRFEEVFTRNI